MSDKEVRIEFDKVQILDWDCEKSYAEQDDMMDKLDNLVCELLQQHKDEKSIKLEVQRIFSRVRYVAWRIEKENQIGTNDEVFKREYDSKWIGDEIINKLKNTTYIMKEEPIVSKIGIREVANVKLFNRDTNELVMELQVPTQDITITRKE